MALAGGNVANLGPQVTTATPTDSHSLAVQLAPDVATGLQPLDADAASGLGWSIHTADGQVLAADQASITGGQTLNLHFASALPTQGTLFYGYGYGRLAVDGDHPGQGNAVYDSAGLPAWTPAGGVTFGGGAAPVVPAPAVPAPAVTAPAVTDWNAVGHAQLDWFAATGGWWGGPEATLLAWDITLHAPASAPAPAPASPAAPDWNTLAAEVMANLAATGHWYL